MRKAALSLLTAAVITMTAGSHAQAEIAWQTNLRAAHSQAKAEGKLLLLHFYSDNCSWCERLEAGSFRAPQVGEAVQKDFIPVKVHADRNPKLTEMFKVTKFPTDVIVSTTGEVLSHSVSPQLPDRYVTMLTEVLPTNVAAAAKIVTNTAPENAVAANGAAESLPTYAQTPAPMPTATTPAPSLTAGPDASVASNSNPAIPAPNASNGFTLPGAALPGQLAGARNEGLTLDMPAEAGAAVSGLVPPTFPAATPALEAPSINAATSGAVEKPTNSYASATESEATPMPELAMQGFCAVTVINDDRWEEGSPQYGVIHLGKLYLFVSEQAMQTFLADPTPYTPVLNEIDVVRFFEEKKIVPGKREWGVKDPVYNRMFFFADEAARNHFEKSYDRYTDASIEVMEKAVRDANPGT
jgi:thiol-disulfide isomerase/thioredoxin